jgi:hypothetical protein
VQGRYLSLPDAIRENLEEIGVGEVHDLGLCTGCRPDLFFSHRKQGPKTGRNLAAVARCRSSAILLCWSRGHSPSILVYGDRTVPVSFRAGRSGLSRNEERSYVCSDKGRW